MTTEIIKHRFTTPYGELLIVSSDSQLLMTVWVEGKRFDEIWRRIQRLTCADKIIDGTSEIIETSIIQLQEYFNGQRLSFNLPMMPLGTAFQQTVWQELARIPYGTTVSYAELAENIGRPSAVRAVANANAVNPLAVIIPCHRVVGANGTLTGYNGGLSIKQRLLELEAAGLNQ